MLKKIKPFLDANPGITRYFFNTGWMLGEKVLRLIAGLFVGAYVARYLQPSGYGEINYVISFVTLFVAFSSLGFDQLLVRELINEPEKEGTLLGTAFGLRLIGALTVFLVIIGFITVTDTPRDVALLFIVITLSFAFDSFGVIDYYFQSKVLAKYVVIVQMISLVLVSILRIFLVWKGASLFWFAVAFSIDYFFQAIGFVCLYMSRRKISQWRFSFERAKKLLNGAWPLIVSTLAVGFYLKSDQVMINWMMGNEASGFYGVAVRLSEIWYFIPVAICGSLYPSILQSKLNNETVFRQRMQSLTDLMVALSVSIGIVMTVLSHFVVTLLFGQDYAASAPILAIYVWSGVFVFIGVANGRRMVAENLQVLLTVMTCLAAVINIVLNYFLIRRIGLLGSALSTLIAYGFSAYFSYALWPRTRNIFYDSTSSFNPFAVVRRARAALKERQF